MITKKNKKFQLLFSHLIPDKDITDFDSFSLHYFVLNTS